MAEHQKWQFWIDRGGTFTDIVARTPDDDLITHKLLSENPGQYDDAALQGIRDVMGLDSDAPLPADDIAVVKMGTTVATNALLERAGARVVLATTRGFGDVIRIGNQARPKIFQLDIALPEMLYTKVLEIDERVRADGGMDTPLDEERAQRDLQSAYDEGYRCLAIVLAHAYRYPDHEKRLTEIARHVGFEQISASHAVNPLMKIVPRGDTTLVDAYLNPVLRRHINHLADALNGTRLMFMQSNGGLADANHFHGKDAILSGPAGGVVGAARVAAASGCEKIIAFDMGGTSTDVFHYAGTFERSFESLVAGTRIRAPMMDINTVAAGGGSIARFDGQRFRVGPGSAGADPGPACYGKGGPLTITDCNLLLGKIDPDSFPKVFGASADEPLDTGAADKAMADTLHRIEKETGRSMTAERAAEGFLEVAVDNMARAIKRISIEKGHDIADYTLVSFGGAGGQHACRVAEALGMGRVIIHPLAGVLSALGIGLADIAVMKEAAVERKLEQNLAADLEDRIADLSAAARAELLDQDVAADRIDTRARLHVRYEGTDTALLIDHDTIGGIRRQFEKQHKRRFGFIDKDKNLIVQSVHVEGFGRSAEHLDHEPRGTSGQAESRLADHQIHSAGEWHTAPVYDGAVLAVGDELTGPVMITEPHGTTVVEPGWQAKRGRDGALSLVKLQEARREKATTKRAEPIKLELFNNMFMAIAEQMGTVLENTAHSVNMKERLDFSCALFDPGGDLVANAPHIPVHLGSMSESVKAAMHRFPALHRDDAIVMNAPYEGGTHLPDITVIAPVFEPGDESGTPAFFVAARGHHADIGGVTPGSMPPLSRDIREEGAVIEPTLLLKRGNFLEKEIRAILADNDYPARNPDQNIADLKAQLAACEIGLNKLAELMTRFGSDVVRAYMSHVQDNAEESVRRLIDRLADGKFEHRMDNGAVIRVTITVDHEKRTAVIDFAGTSAQMKNNFNAPAAVTRAAVLYVFRALIEDDIPLNAGCLKPLEIRIPEKSLLNPAYPAAVVAGNVETSQAVVNVLLGALGAQAASQGTMNNFTFGDDSHQYYETICGGVGAGPGFNGASAVQAHMTNSRLTDAEILEMRYPVLLRRFAIRRGSGGDGEYHGGDGVIRDIEFLEPLSASILSDSRQSAPFGLSGGSSARPGRNQLRRADGSLEELPGCTAVEMNAGDRFMIETPGGGGFGGPSDR